MWQSAFQKLVSIQQVAGRVLAGKERVTQLFLIRLTETFVKDLSTNPELWGLIEEEPGSLGPLGLQQYIFDMQFLIVVAKNMGFLSRTVFQAISQEEERMKEAYVFGGADLDRSVMVFSPKSELRFLHFFCLCYCSNSDLGRTWQLGLFTFWFYSSIVQCCAGSRVATDQSFR